MKRFGILEQFDDLLIKSQKSAKFYDSDSSNFAAIKAPATISADYTLTLPGDDGTSGQVLSTDGSGVLSWISTISSTLAAGNVYIGNGSNVATAVDTASVGDISADTTNGLQIKSGVIVNADVNASAAIAYSKLNLSASIVNADVATAAAIALDKLAAVTASRALISDASGFVSASAVTSTELGYVSGVTSAIQTQLNARAIKFAATWAAADGATKAVTHSLGTKDIIVQVYDMSDDSTIEVDSVVRTSTSVVTLTASQAPAVNWRVVIIAA